LPLPLVATQILWLNLVTDVVGGVPLVLEPSHGYLMSKNPRKRKENILSLEMVPFLVIIVGVMVLVTLYMFTQLLPIGVDAARTGAFAAMSFTQLFNVLNMRSSRRSIFSIGIFSNRTVIWGLFIVVFLQTLIFTIPFLREVFHFAPLTTGTWIEIVLLSSFVLWFGEIYKFLRYRNSKVGVK
jgi:Ca2+-transporting ATPase